MAKLIIVITTDNSAFEEELYGKEVARILRKIADDAENTHTKGTYNDINGNKAVEVTNV